jgi:Flp pilus assembly protein TadD
VHGSLDEAFEHCHKATKLSPRDPLEYFFQFCLAAAYQLNGEHEKAIEAARHSISLNPNNCWSYILYASSCVRLGMMDEAKRAIGQTEKLSKTAVPNIFRCWAEGTLWHIHADPIRMIYSERNTDDG